MAQKKRSRFSLLKNYYKRVWPVLGPSCRGDARADGKGGVLLIKRDAIGDFVLSTAFLNVASLRWTEFPVTLVCSPGVAGLARMLYPHWTIRAVKDDVSEYKKSRWRPGPLQHAVRAWPVADRLVNLRAARFQEEMIFDSWVPARNKTALANVFNYYDASYRMTPDKRVYSDVLDAATSEPPELCREIVGYRKLVKHFFPDENSREIWPMLDFGGKAEELDRAIFEKGFRGKSSLAFCPFPSATIRRYPMDVLAGIISRAARRYDVAVEILGGPDDRNEAVELARRIDCPKGARSFAGEFSLEESLRAVAHARVAVGVETGLMHAAIAAGTPSIVIIGGGHYGYFGPWGDRRRTRWLTHAMPCFDCNWECSQAEPFCIQSISPNVVEQSVDEVLKNG